jgi:8-oxo-dGTP pyrophosphatase MutT (NUDIX family)
VSRSVAASIREPLREALLERQERTIHPAHATPASVLIPLVDRDGEAYVWLIRRTQAMRRHSGQVAFPGGKRDHTDESALAAALRETEEELGFPRDRVEVHGRLDDLETITGFIVSPFVGWLREDLPARPSAVEIARAFCVPLAAFVHAEPRARPFRGRGMTRIAPSYEVDGELVWGATARIMMNLVAVVREVLNKHGLT